MSYCRWSSDDFRCDLYVYGASDGVVIHVASRRHAIEDGDLPPPAPDNDVDGWVARHMAVMALVQQEPLADIGLPHDGEDFYGLGYAEAAAKVRELIQLGYRCHPSVADALEADAQSDVPRGRAPQGEVR